MDSEEFTMAEPKTFRSCDEFFWFYLEQHRDAGNRRSLGLMLSGRLNSRLRAGGKSSDRRIRLRAISDVLPANRVSGAATSVSQTLPPTHSIVSY